MSVFGDFFGGNTQIIQQLAQILASQQIIIAQGAKMAQGLTDLQTAMTTLTSAVTANTTAVSAAATNFAALAADLAAANNASGDPDATIEGIATALNTQATALQNSTAALSAAVTAATPAPAPAAGATGATGATGPTGS